MPQQVDPEMILRDLPQGEKWKDHLKDDLLPFWTMKTALGDPIGNFPTYRCNDGSLYDPDDPCSELKNAAPEIVELDRDYVRSKSRQIYAYGVAYHLIGDETVLQYAKAGVNYLRKYALDREHGGAYTYWKGEDRQPGPDAEQRTSQDLAYALSGLGFFYYLTRDDEILSDILELKKYIFDTYYDDELDLITWVKKSVADGDDSDRKELVAQLDQVYGYMLWLAPTLPEPHRSAWKKELVHLAQIMIGQFYSPRQNMFWGAITSPAGKRLGTDHTDFGHSIKTLWLIHQIGKLTDNLDLTIFATERAALILEAAYIEATGSWARRLDASGKLDEDKEWWILAELDQTAATLSLIDPAYSRYLLNTYNYWFAHMVDHKDKGVWHMVRASDNTPVDAYPKQHSWKNALHTFEHALVGYITAQQLHGKPVQLYYAFTKEPDRSTVHPYFYLAKVREMREVSGVESTPFKKHQVVFTDIR